MFPVKRTCFVITQQLRILTKTKSLVNRSRKRGIFSSNKNAHRNARAKIVTILHRPEKPISTGGGEGALGSSNAVLPVNVREKESEKEMGGGVGSAQLGKIKEGGLLFTLKKNSVLKTCQAL
jgi:hypothetical protein